MLQWPPIPNSRDPNAGATEQQCGRNCGRIVGYYRIAEHFRNARNDARLETTLVGIVCVNTGDVERRRVILETQSLARLGIADRSERRAAVSLVSIADFQTYRLPAAIACEYHLGHGRSVTLGSKLPSNAEDAALAALGRVAGVCDLRGKADD